MIVKERKAVSALVATVLLILITVAAVGIIWGAIMPMMNRAMEMGQACLNARLSINTESGYTCYNSTVPGGSEVQVMIARGSEEFDLAGMHLIVSGGGESRTFAVRADAGNDDVRMFDDAVYTNTEDLPNVNEERTYVVDTSTFTAVDEIKVAPIAQVGNTEKVCDISSRTMLVACE